VNKERLGKSNSMAVPDIEYENYGSQTSQVSSMVSLDISLISLVNQNTALVVNLASEKPLDALEILDKRLFSGDR
jgi:hypothetical protein